MQPQLRFISCLFFPHCLSNPRLTRARTDELEKVSCSCAWTTWGTPGQFWSSSLITYIHTSSSCHQAWKFCGGCWVSHQWDQSWSFQCQPSISNSHWSTGEGPARLDSDDRKIANCCFSRDTLQTMTILMHIFFFLFASLSNPPLYYRSTLPPALKQLKRTRRGQSLLEKDHQVSCL